MRATVLPRSIAAVVALVVLGACKSAPSGNGGEAGGGGAGSASGHGGDFGSTGNHHGGAGTHVAGPGGGPGTGGGENEGGAPASGGGGAGEAGGSGDGGAGGGSGSPSSSSASSSASSSGASSSSSSSSASSSSSTGGGPVCGNGVVEAGEACDDGSAAGTDGCVGCKVTAGYACSGSPSNCTTAILKLQNNTSFPLISVVVDGVEYITQCNTGILIGSAFTLPLTPNQAHTWSTKNGLYNAGAGCPKVFHETWAPTSFNHPGGTYPLSLVNRSLHAYVNDDKGYTTSCWESIYTDGANTRIARLRLNDDGSWRFYEFYNLGGAVTRQGYGTSWNETSRTVDFKLSYNLVASTITWAAEYDVGGGNYIANGVDAFNANNRLTLLYLRQTTAQGVPTNCPPP